MNDAFRKGFIFAVTAGIAIVKLTSAVVWAVDTLPVTATATASTGAQCGTKLDSLSRYAPPVTPRDHAVRGFALDLDDNSFFLPTKIYIFKNNPDGTRSELEITTKAFAANREQIGQSGDYKDYFLDLKDPVHGSMRRFGDASGPGNAFLEDLIWAVDHLPPEQWQGPAWKALVHATSTPETAAAMYLITARHHAPEKILAGFQFLKDRGYIAHVPRIENIFPVSYPGLPEVLKARWPDLDLQQVTAADASTAKALIMQHLLGEIQSVPIVATTSNIINQDDTGNAPLHTFGFSDDDYGNYTAAVSALQKLAVSGKIPNVKITVFYTGLNGPTPPTSVVITTDGKSRPRTNAETIYSQQMLSRTGS